MKGFWFGVLAAYAAEFIVLLLATVYHMVRGGKTDDDDTV